MALGLVVATTKPLLVTKPEVVRSSLLGITTDVTSVAPTVNGLEKPFGEVIDPAIPGAPYTNTVLVSA